MNLLTLLDMAAMGMPDRIAIGRTRTAEFDFTAMTYPGLLERACAGAATLRDLGVRELVYLGVNTVDFPTALFAAAWAGIPLVPVNYRLSGRSLTELLAHHRDALVVSDLHPPPTPRFGAPRGGAPPVPGPPTARRAGPTTPTP
ncbi:AMP-binding protein [Mycobacterium sp. ELW1]|uniref:AMP-binding protein n=1 Tax=Mycobacterium sp. ELW1 TaxID=1547487 RepID=UPI00336A0A15